MKKKITNRLWGFIALIVLLGLFYGQEFNRWLFDDSSGGHYHWFIVLVGLNILACVCVLLIAFALRIGPTKSMVSAMIYIVFAVISYAVSRDTFPLYILVLGIGFAILMLIVQAAKETLEKRRQKNSYFNS